MPPAPKNPVLVSSLGYRRAVVRHCTEQLREFEGRLEVPSGPRWESQLLSCEDLAGVARLMLALQRRLPEVLKGADNAWLEELSQLSSTDIDERAIELTRRVKHRLDTLREVVPYAVEPPQLLGAAVVRGSESTSGACRGRVIEYDRSTGFRVLYADGDTEDLSLRELQAVLLRERTRGVGATEELDTAMDGVGGVPIPGPHAPPDENLSVQAIFDRLKQRNPAPTTRPAAAAPMAKREPWPSEDAKQRAAAGAKGTKKGATRAPVGTAPRRAATDDVEAASKPAADRRPHDEGEDAPPCAKRPRAATPAEFDVRDGAEVAQRERADAQLPAHGDHDGDAAAPTTVQALPSGDPCVAVPSSSLPAVAAPVAAPSSLPEYGLSLVEVGAAAGRKRLPRELRNLAMPDRDWNVAVPFFTTAAKTREQFSSSADTQAAAAVAREMHQQRELDVAEAFAASKDK